MANETPDKDNSASMDPAEELKEYSAGHPNEEQKEERTNVDSTDIASTDIESTAVDSKVADYWDAHTDDTFRGETYWLANPLINRRHQLMAAGGRDYPSWVNFSVDHYLGKGSLFDRIFKRRERKPVDRVLSIGCGDGALERHLASIDTARRIEGIDLAPRRVEIAEEEARKAGMADLLHYSVCNVETSEFPGNEYDAIYFNSSLHHMSDLDAILARCRAALKRSGYLFVNEYIGPNRMAYSEREKEAMQGVFQMIPKKYRISHADHDRGQVRTHVYFPDPEEVARVDPSEAIHSEEIMDAINRHFRVEEFNFTGGTLLQYMLQDIAGNFRQEDSESVKILDLVFNIEKSLVDSGDLKPHFAMIVARP